MQNRYLSEKIRPEVSLAFEINDQLSGICLNATNHTHAYCGGFGVYKEYRRRGYGKYFFQENLHFLKENGITEYSLEVINENVAAFLLYKSMGFEVFDEVFVLDGVFSESSAFDPSLRIEIVPFDAMLGACSFDTLRRVWSCSPFVLNCAKNLQSFLVYSSELIGGGAFSKKENGIMYLRDMRVKKGMESSFFTALNQRFTGEKGCIYFAHKSFSITDVFFRHQWNIVHRQFALNTCL
jgi:hypothetical protein